MITNCLLLGALPHNKIIRGICPHAGLCSQKFTSISFADLQQVYPLLLSSDNPSKTAYLQKCSNAVELNSSLSGGSARNALHSSSAFSWHTLGKKSITQTVTWLCMSELRSLLQVQMWSLTNCILQRQTKSTLANLLLIRNRSIINLPWLSYLVLVLVHCVYTVSQKCLTFDLL